MKSTDVWLGAKIRVTGSDRLYTVTEVRASQYLDQRSIEFAAIADDDAIMNSNVAVDDDFDRGLRILRNVVLIPIIIVALVTTAILYGIVAYLLAAVIFSAGVLGGVVSGMLDDGHKSA